VNVNESNLVVHFLFLKKEFHESTYIRLSGLVCSWPFKACRTKAYPAEICAFGLPGHTFSKAPTIILILKFSKHTGSLLNSQP
jgi:hypothetical protein